MFFLRLGSFLRNMACTGYWRGTLFWRVCGFWRQMTVYTLLTDFEAVDDNDIINKAYLDSNLLKINGHLSKLEKDYNEFKKQYNKQSVEEFLIQRARKTTIQILYDKGLFDNYANADKVLEDFLFTTRRRVDLSDNT